MGCCCCCCPDEAQLSRASGENREPGLKWAKWRRSRVKAAQQPNSHDLLLFSVLLLLVRLMLLLPMWLCFFPHIRIVLTICFLFFFFACFTLCFRLLFFVSVAVLRNYFRNAYFLRLKCVCPTDWVMRTKSLSSSLWPLAVFFQCSTACTSRTALLASSLFGFSFGHQVHIMHYSIKLVCRRTDINTWPPPAPSPLWIRKKTLNHADIDSNCRRQQQLKKKTPRANKQKSNHTI